jgi:hypothetical protein
MSIENARIAEDNGYQFESERDMDRFFQVGQHACLMHKMDECA